MSKLPWLNPFSCGGQPWQVKRSFNCTSLLILGNYTFVVQHFEKLEMSFGRDLDKDNTKALSQTKRTELYCHNTPRNNHLFRFTSQKHKFRTWFLLWERGINKLFRRTEGVEMRRTCWVNAASPPSLYPIDSLYRPHLMNIGVSSRREDTKLFFRWYHLRFCECLKNAYFAWQALSVRNWITMVKNLWERSERTFWVKNNYFRNSIISSPALGTSYCALQRSNFLLFICF